MYMNKEVIYLEPEDDITDILTKLQRAEQKLVALVPPKKAAMFRSAVNMKLVARAAKESKKIAVIVTADPAVVKLAMAAQIPVAKTLQSRPVVPTPEMVKSAEEEEQIIDEDLADGDASDTTKGKKPDAKTSPEASKTDSKATAAKKGDVIDLNEESLENDAKNAKKDKNKPDKNKKVPKIEKYRKWIIIGSVAAVILIVFGVWAFVFAPAVDITVAMHTSSSSFSEDVSFTTDEVAANVEEGKFFAKKLTYEDKFEADFTATGQEDRGEKAKGSIQVSYTLNQTAIDNHLHKGFSLDVPAGTEFTANGLRYRSTSGATFSWDGEIPSGQCKNSKSCELTATVNIEAVNSGSNYDVGANATWQSGIGGVTAKSSGAISGGTTKMVTIVTQADVNKAAEGRESEDASDGKERLMDQISDDEIAIEASYATEVGDLKSSPSVGSEASDGKAHLSAVTTYSIYVLKKSQVEEFIDKKTELSEDQRIYSIGEPYFERFNNIDEGARMKTTIKVGPTVTEDNLMERVKGHKIGEVQSLLRSINGVSSVDIKPSYFWVTSVPKDDKKVKIDLTVEDEE